MKNSEGEKADIDRLEKIHLQHLSEGERKALGQVFTPRYIIRFILHHLDRLTEINQTKPLFDLRVLDPACGLGRFLLETYDFLERKLKAAHWDEQNIRNTLLSQVLHGIDIDPLSVEFTYLALLEKKGNTTIDKLSIIQGNILEEDSVQQEFDVIIGNPPYFLISQQKHLPRGKQFHTTYVPEDLINKYRINYRSWPEKGQDPNIFYLFIERGIQFLREGGYLGFIIPDILISGESTENLRKFILETCCIKKIFLIEGQVFGEIGISNIIIILQRVSEAKIREKNKIEVINTSTLELKENDEQGEYYKFDEVPHYIPQAIFNETPQKNFAIRINAENAPIFQNIFAKIKEKKLIKCKNVLHIQRGIENLKREDALDSNIAPEPTHQKLISASNVEKYKINWHASLFSNKLVDYNPQKLAYQHIQFKRRDWFVQPKIVLKRVSNKLIAALDEAHEKESDYFFTMDSIQMIWLKEESQEKYDLRVILAILNSEFMNFYYQTLFSYKKLFSRVQKAFILELPLPPKILQDKQRKICDLVDQLLRNLNPKIEEELNQLIYNLYFTDKELIQFRNSFKTPITLRDLSGIGITKYWELKKVGIKTLEELIHCDTKKIVSLLKGIGKISIEKWKIEAKKVLENEEL